MRIRFASALLVIASTVHAQEPATPRTSYRVSRDSTVAHSGVASQKVASTAATKDNELGVSNRMIRADDYAGKRVRYSAWVKTANATAGGVGLWLRIDGGGGPMALDNMSNRSLKGTNDWTRVAIVLDVPTEAAGFTLGMMLHGPGEAWMDDVSIEIVGNDVPVTAQPMVGAPHWQTPEAQRATYAKYSLSFENPGFEAVAAVKPPPFR